MCEHIHAQTDVILCICHTVIFSPCICPILSAISLNFGLIAGGWCSKEVRGGYGVGFGKRFGKNGG